MTRHNVVFFGETGVGKSSLINMLAGSNVAQTSSKATSCTLESRGYPVKISKSLFYLVDTAGLEEGDQGRVPKSDAIVQLYTLLKQMEDGVSLLVFVMRPKITDGVVNNWRLFQEVICKYQVPAVVIITGLENEEDMDDWWVMNKETFREYGIQPDGNACVTATRGHCETRRVVIDNEKGMNAQISTDIVVFRALRNFRRFQWEKIPPITVDIYNKMNCHGIQHKMV